MTHQMTEPAAEFHESHAPSSIRSDSNTFDRHSSGDGTGNVFQGVPEHLPDELMTSLLTGQHIRVERIVSQGHTSPADFWYDQNQHEWVLLLHGAARLQFEDRHLEMKSGDFVHIPAHQKHRVDWTSPTEQTIWLAVFYDGP